MGKQRRFVLQRRPVEHGIFVLVLLFLGCAVTQPVLVRAEEKNPAPKQRAVYKLTKDTGWNVCRDMVKNLNKLQQTEASFVCELKFHPSMTQFSEPEWEELKIEDYLWEVFAIEHRIIFFKYPRMEEPFSDWKELYKEALKRGYNTSKLAGKAQDFEARHPFHPRLRMSKVRFEQDGPQNTILAYSLTDEYVQKCMEIKKCDIEYVHLEYAHPAKDYEEYKKRLRAHTDCVFAIWQNWGMSIDHHEYGEFIAIYHPEYDSLIGNIESIGGAEREVQYIGGFSRRPFLYNGRFFAIRGAGRGGYKISRVRTHPGWSDGETSYNSYDFQSICEIERHDSHNSTERR